MIDEVYEKLVKDYGKFPGTPVVFHKKEQKEKKKSSYVMFCPSCGYETTVKAKMFDKYGRGTLPCICGTKMGIDLSDETNEEESESEN